MFSLLFFFPLIFNLIWVHASDSNLGSSPLHLRLIGSLNWIIELMKMKIVATNLSRIKNLTLRKNVIRKVSRPLN